MPLEHNDPHPAVADAVGVTKARYQENTLPQTG